MISACTIQPTNQLLVRITIQLFQAFSAIVWIPLQLSGFPCNFLDFPAIVEISQQSLGLSGFHSNFELNFLASQYNNLFALIFRVSIHLAGETEHAAAAIDRITKLPPRTACFTPRAPHEHLTTQIIKIILVRSSRSSYDEHLNVRFFNIIPLKISKDSFFFRLRIDAIRFVRRIESIGRRAGAPSIRLYV